MGERRKLLDRDIVEEISIDHLLKTAVLRINITQHLTAQATLIHRHNGVNQLSHLQVVSRSILQLAILVEIVLDVNKYIPQRLRSTHRDVIVAAATITRMRARSVNPVTHIEIKQNLLQLLG